MASPIYRLPDHLPLVWTSATSVQVGIDPPRAHVDNIPDNAAPLLHALTHGAPASALAMLARTHRVSQEWVDHLVASMRPALTATPPVPPARVEMWSSSEAIAGLIACARQCGLEVYAPEALTDDSVPTSDTVVLVADYLVHPRWADQLLRGSVRHCSVIFSDQTITVGPVVTPGETPCLTCLELQRRDDTVGWLEVSSQIWGKPSPLHTPHTIGIASALLLLLLNPGDVFGITPGFSRAVFRADEGELSWQKVNFHPQCSCRGLDLSL